MVNVRLIFSRSLYTINVENLVFLKRFHVRPGRLARRGDLIMRLLRFARSAFGRFEFRIWLRL